MLFLGLNTVRIGAAGIRGLYPDLVVVVGSLGATIPASSARCRSQTPSSRDWTIATQDRSPDTDRHRFPARY